MKTIFFILMLLASPVFAAAPDIGSVSATSFPNEAVSFPVTADFSVPVGSSSFTIKYDPALLTFSNVTVGTANAAWDIVSYSPSAGTVNIGMFSSSGVSISGTAQQIAIVNFTVNSVPNATLSSPNIDFSVVMFDQNSITNVTNGNFSLGILGDVTGDGKVTIADAQLVAQAVVGSATLSPNQVLSAEVDGGKAVDIYDAYLISEYVVGKITSL